MTITDRDKRILAILVVIALAAAIYMLAIKPNRSEVKKLDDSIAGVREELTGLQDQVSGYRTAQSRYAVDYADLLKLSDAVPPDISMEKFLRKLDGMTTGKDLRFVHVSVESYSQPLLAPSGGLAFDSSGASSGGSGSSTAGSSSGSASKTGSQAGSKPAQPASADKPPVPGAPFEQLAMVLKVEGDFSTTHGYLSEVDDLVKLGEEGVEVDGRLLLIEGFTMRGARLGFPDVMTEVAATAFALPDGGSAAPTPVAKPSDGSEPGPVAKGEASAPSQPVPAAASGVGKQ